MTNNGYNKILLTHDGSSLADTAVPHVILLAKKFHAEVHILQIVESYKLNTPIIVPEAPMYISENDLKKMIRSEKTSAKKNVTRIKDDLIQSGISDVEAVVIDGVAIEEIIKYANENTIDVIIMATHGRSGLKRVLLGSVADNVIRNAGCPVLLINAKKKL